MLLASPALTSWTFHSRVHGRRLLIELLMCAVQVIRPKVTTPSTAASSAVASNLTARSV